MGLVLVYSIVFSHSPSAVIRDEGLDLRLEGQ